MRYKLYNKIIKFILYMMKNNYDYDKINYEKVSLYKIYFIMIISTY